MSELKKYDADVAVLGLGSMGLSTCYYLAKAGQKVLGLEQFEIYNDKSSHVGDTRLIRKSYFEHPDYVPLLHRAYDNWKQLEHDFGVQVFYQDGLAYLGDKRGDILSGVLKSAEIHGLQVSEDWPTSFDKGVSKDCLWEPDAGYLDVPKVFETYKRGLENFDVLLHPNTKVESWKQLDDCIQIQTSKNIFRVKKLVISAGAWTSKLISSTVPLQPTRQVLAWFESDDDAFDMPCWCLDHPQGLGIYYGFSKSDKGFKIGHHYPGRQIDPDHEKLEITSEEITDLQQVLQRLAPDQTFKYREAANCIYTNTPDEHFIVDYLPDSEAKVALAAGFSGHGFKFVSAMGESLADMVLEERKSGLKLFALDRFS